MQPTIFYYIYLRSGLLDWTFLARAKKIDESTTPLLSCDVGLAPFSASIIFLPFSAAGHHHNQDDGIKHC